MTQRRRHPHKHIDDAIQFALHAGWRLELGGAHAWGLLYCPHDQRGGCIVRIYSTPRSADDHANDVRRKVRKCPHHE